CRWPARWSATTRHTSGLRWRLAADRSSEGVIHRARPIPSSRARAGSWAPGSAARAKRRQWRRGPGAAQWLAARTAVRRTAQPVSSRVSRSAASARESSGSRWAAGWLITSRPCTRSSTHSRRPPSTTTVATVTSGCQNLPSRKLIGRRSSQVVAIAAELDFLVVRDLGSDVHGRLELGGVDAVGQLDDVVEHVAGDLPGADLLPPALLEQLQRLVPGDAIAADPGGRREHLADPES